MNNPIAKVQSLVECNLSIVNFGTPAEAVSDEWIAKAETALKRPLPESYKWFLREYAGGEIGGEEIYSIYGLPFDSANGGDIVFQNMASRKAKLLDDDKLVVSETDLGEVFFFDYSDFHNGECPILLRMPSGEPVRYADDFYEFLLKRITVHSK